MRESRLSPTLAALAGAALLAGCLFETDRRAGGGSDIGNGGSVAGLALTREGIPAAGVTVRLRPSGYLAPLPALARAGSASALDTLGQVRTGSDGRFRFAGLDSGGYRLELLSPDSSLGALEDFTLSGGGKAVELGETRLDLTGGLRIVLPAGPVSGRAVVRLFGLERTLILSPGADTVIGNLPAGLHALRIASTVTALEARGLSVRPDSITPVAGLAEPCGNRTCDSAVVADFLRDNGLPGDLGPVINASGRVTGLVLRFPDSTLRLRTVGALRRLARIKAVQVEGPLLPDSLGEPFFDALAQMDSLWFLRIAGSGDKAIRRIPEGLGRLRNLTQLYLLDDSLENLPASIGELRKLEMLFLRGNRLATLPEGVGGLPLRELHVPFNRLTALPAGVYAMPTLVKVDIFGNKLCDLKAEEKAALTAKGADPATSGQDCP
jgi:hypothetical protein